MTITEPLLQFFWKTLTLFPSMNWSLEPGQDGEKPKFTGRVMLYDQEVTFIVTDATLLDTPSLWINLPRLDEKASAANSRSAVDLITEKLRELKGDSDIEMLKEAIRWFGPSLHDAPLFLVMPTATGESSSHALMLRKANLAYEVLRDFLAKYRN